MIYLDNAATTPVSPAVMEAMLPYFTEHYANPGSVHFASAPVIEAIERARAAVAAPIWADPENIIFTSGGSEANNLALFGLARHLADKGKYHVVMSNVEHPSVLNCAQPLYERFGIEVSFANVSDDGIVHLESVLEQVTDRTGLVSVMGVNNETGAVNPIRQIGASCREHGILFHTDCVQAYGNIDIAVDRDCIDFLSVSGHKFHAPKGIGFLYARDKSILDPLIYGGGQEDGMRSGTENVPGIVGIGAAALELSYFQMSANGARYRRLQQIFLDKIHKLGNTYINGKPYEYGKTLNLRFDGIDGETLVLLLSGRGVCVSAGSACHSHSAQPSHVLTAMGLIEDEARSSIRISFSDWTTEKEVFAAADELVSAVETLRRYGGTFDD